MFDKLKQIKQLRDLQKEVQAQKFDSERQGVRVVVNGAMQIEEVVLSAEMDAKSQERIVKDCLNDAMHKAQTAVSQRFAGLMG